MGEKMFNEVGLRLLLCPLGSNIVVRTACCSVGIVLPVYSTFKAIEEKNQDEQQRLLLYWADLTCEKQNMGAVRTLLMYMLSAGVGFPMYYYTKFAFLVRLQLPSTNEAKLLYTRHLRPFLLRHQARLDHVIGFIYREMGKFVIAHQEEFHFARTLLLKIFASVREAIHPMPRQASGAIEAPRQHTHNSESESED